MEEMGLPVRKRRRDSLGRTLDRIRLAMSVRRSSGTPALGPMTPANDKSTPLDVPLEGSSVAEQTTGPSVSLTTATGISSTEMPPLSSHDDDRSPPNSTNADATARTLPLIVDTSAPIEVGDPRDPIPPFSASMASFKSASARALFEKYGMQFEEGIQQRPNERNYIDRGAIRIRLHWECHKCKNGFGKSKACTACGHERCAKCTRSPLERVREIFGDTSVMKHIDDQAAKATVEEDAVLLPFAIGADASALVPTDSPTGAGTTEALPVNMAARDEAVGDMNTDTDIVLAHMQRANRRTAGMGPTLHPRPKGDRVRCTCHECGAYFIRLHTYKCQNCGHDRCSACPLVPETTESPFSYAAKDMDPPLRRVYRKPRQRVRWSCHQCQATFLAFRNCGNCGHERCGLCIRSPYVLSTSYHVASSLN